MSMYTGHFNPSWVLSVADVTIIAQLANLKGNVAVYKVLNIEKRHNYAS